MRTGDDQDRADRGGQDRERPPGRPPADRPAGRPVRRPADPSTPFAQATGRNRAGTGSGAVPASGPTGPTGGSGVPGLAAGAGPSGAPGSGGGTGPSGDDLLDRRFRALAGPAERHATAPPLGVIRRRARRRVARQAGTALLTLAALAAVVVAPVRQPLVGTLAGLVGADRTTTTSRPGPSSTTAAPATSGRPATRPTDPTTRPPSGASAPVPPATSVPPPTTLAGTSTTVAPTTTTDAPGGGKAPVYTVRVWFDRDLQKNGRCDPPQPVKRQAGPNITRETLDQLLRGPSDTERAARWTGPFWSGTAGIVRSVTIKDKVVSVDFNDLSKLRLPKHGEVCRAARLVPALDATLTQFDHIDHTRYYLRGSEQAFWAFLDKRPPKH